MLPSSARTLYQESSDPLPLVEELLDCVFMLIRPKADRSFICFATGVALNLHRHIPRIVNFLAARREVCEFPFVPRHALRVTYAGSVKQISQPTAQIPRLSTGDRDESHFMQKLDELTMTSDKFLKRVTDREEKLIFLR